MATGIAQVLTHFLILLQFHFLRLVSYQKAFRDIEYSVIPCLKIFHHSSHRKFSGSFGISRWFKQNNALFLWRKNFCKAFMMCRSHLLRYFCKEKFWFQLCVDATVNYCEMFIVFSSVTARTERLCLPIWASDLNGKTLSLHRKKICSVSRCTDHTYFWKENTFFFFYRVQSWIDCEMINVFYWLP